MRLWFRGKHMAINLVSPGVNIREVDLTRGNIVSSRQNVGAIVGPFQKGPVNVPTIIQSEQELLDIFGKPQTSEDQYEYWLSASNYLSYGGALNVVRSDVTGNPSALINSNVTIANTSISLKITSYEDYQSNRINDVDWVFSARNPGSWANDLKVCVIDAAADQTVTGISTSGIQVGLAVTQTKTATQYLQADGTVGTFTGYVRGLITGIGNSSFDIKVISRVPSAGQEVDINYNYSSVVSSLVAPTTTALTVTGTAGTVVTTVSSGAIQDWYDNQVISLKNGIIYWKSIAPKPGTSQYALERNAKSDEVHVVVVDDTGVISGVSGNVLEKFTGLSKGIDARISPSQPIYYKEFVNQNSNYVFVGFPEAGRVSDITQLSGNTYSLTSSPWGTAVQDKSYNVIGSRLYNLVGGTDYSGVNFLGGYSVSTQDIIASYRLFLNVEASSINFILGGPSGGPTIYDAQAKANELINIAESRKDCIAVVSPYKSSVVGSNNSTTQTNAILQFFSPIKSSSYVIFDSGYKYTLDRFNSKFVYIPCNSDVAGAIVRTSINSYPWYSPAGSTRGTINNIIKLAYNPTKTQRDSLYSNRINPIISSAGSGYILFGDKTGLAYPSAFDRINVRMLFLTLEQSIEQAARAQLFEFNDSITRTNFINIVEPYLRDVRAKRGISEFILVCDESNNTPDVIDANEFKADIYIKPNRSINFVGLTFVATKTGVSFSEVVGSV